MGQPEGREPLNSRVQRTVSPLGWRLAADAAHLEPVQFRRPLHVCGGNLAGSRPALADDEPRRGNASARITSARGET